MCTNFSSTRQGAWFERKLKKQVPTNFSPEAYPGFEAPILKAKAGQVEDLISLARFGLIPVWAKDEKIARHTYNARSETVQEKPSFQGAYRERRFAVVLLDDFFEPCYQTGQVVRHRIQIKSGEPFGVACLWERWLNKNKESGPQRIDSFTMLTINADAHPVMNKMHAPGEEKRSPLVLTVDQFDLWLTASHKEAQALLTGTLMPELISSPAPKERAVKTSREALTQNTSSAQGTLF